MEELEYNYVVRSRTEGSVLPNQSMISTMNQMGSATFRGALLGKVKVIVEMENNHITKSKIVWVEGSDPTFKRLNESFAEQLLQEAVALVQGSGDNGGMGELKVVIVGKK